MIVRLLVVIISLGILGGAGYLAWTGTGLVSAAAVAAAKQVPRGPTGSVRRGSAGGIGIGRTK